MSAIEDTIACLSASDSYGEGTQMWNKELKVIKLIKRKGHEASATEVGYFFLRKEHWDVSKDLDALSPPG
jgi:hypothetical protein